MARAALITTLTRHNPIVDVVTRSRTLEFQAVGHRCSGVLDAFPHLSTKVLDTTPLMLPMRTSSTSEHSAPTSTTDEVEDERDAEDLEELARGASISVSMATMAATLAEHAIRSVEGMIPESSDVVDASVANLDVAETDGLPVVESSQ